MWIAISYCTCNLPLSDQYVRKKLHGSPLLSSTNLTSLLNSKAYVILFPSMFLQQRPLASAAESLIEFVERKMANNWYHI